ncbi:D-2-hydroxyacid dehydrogenase family protein [Microbacterium sp. UBA3394]|uniref:D-2-hydroxyacid dehydrogenase family protein n=1 Tax=Microbacterium sp. UBA3394 TaxID=1946945 RepID=UPI000C8A7E14|nr:D-2-hydroxyacid dehydrogenase family protein [Microbacterium sp. UBA3394]MAB81632.1 hydroxyacid dehydrogenase [Planctomycetota bacterium]|tara:strand:+ start:36453 stop:37409 length:957 start_codon:yes stop_codon:yes gene_type:complete
MTVRIVVLDDWEGFAADSGDWSALGDVDLDVVTEHIDGAEALAERIGDAEVVVAMRERSPLPAVVIDALPRLRLLVTTGMQNAAIDLDVCRRRGVTVCGTRSHPGAASELTWALILAVARRTDLAVPEMREGHWRSRVGTALHGRRLGLLGLGRVGSTVARVGSAFGMEVSAWTPSLTSERAAETGAVRAGFDEVVASADILSLHLALTPETAGIIDARALGLLPPRSWLVNTARAGLVDQEALVDALDAGSIAGAALDVFDREPLAADSPLRARRNVLLTPHSGYVTDANLARWFDDIRDNIRAWIDGNPIRLVGDA